MSRSVLGTSPLLLTCGVVLLWASASILAAPSDILEIPGNLAEGQAPEAIEISAGDGKVSGQTGSFGYSIPILAPPGRVGASPSLALIYSSQAPLYGGLAAGWTLNLPTISRDFSDGRYAAERWTSSLAGRELVTTSEEAPSGFSSYRAQSDTSYARYQRGPNSWRVLSHDGTAAGAVSSRRRTSAVRFRRSFRSPSGPCRQ